MASLFRRIRFYGKHITLGAKFAVAIATAIGVAAGLIVLAVGLRYEHGRLTPQFVTSHGAAAVAGGDTRAS